MRVLVTGANGMLGRDVVSALEARGHHLVPTDQAEFDITNPTDCAKVAAKEFGDVDWLVNCAGYTAVDLAEEEEQRAFEVNGFGVAYLGQACTMANVKLCHISTDFVFDGEKTEPYTEDDPVRPLSAYGRSKLYGEQSLLGNYLSVVLRTSWLFGPHGKSFPRTILQAWDEGRDLRVVFDQIGCPTYTGDLARVLVDVLETNPFPGVYHACGQEAMSWFDFAVKTIEICSGQTPRIQPVKSEEWPTPATRPRYSVLSTKRLLALGIEPMRPLEEALREFCSRLKEGTS